MSNELKKFLKFGLVGLSNTAIDLASFNLFLFWQFDRYLAVSLSFLIAATNSYLINHSWTFKDSGQVKNWRQYSQFLLVSSLGLIINNGVLFIFGIMPWHTSELARDNLAKLVAIIIVVGWNYSMSRWVIFRGSSQTTQSSS